MKSIGILYEEQFSFQTLHPHVCMYDSALIYVTDHDEIDIMVK